MGSRARVGAKEQMAVAGAHGLEATTLQPAVATRACFCFRAL